MGRNHIGDLLVTRFTSAIPAFVNDLDLHPDIPKKWGLGWMINEAQTPEGRSAGSLAWVGTANTYYWIDPARDVAGVIPRCSYCRSPIRLSRCFSRRSNGASMPRSTPGAARMSGKRSSTGGHFGRDNCVGASGRA